MASANSAAVNANGLASPSRPAVGSRLAGLTENVDKGRRNWELGLRFDPEILPRRIDFEKYMAPVRRDDEVESAEMQPEYLHECVNLGCDVGRQLNRLFLDVKRPAPPVDLRFGICL